jgi:hypothetical protein
MNLYKVQEELKFKSIPELQRFANGMDPKVPAWMASAVLKAKVDEKERWDNMQGAAKGQMPSVKEQLEQKAGLMQQQAAQTPMGLAQPAAQPPQGPVQMPGGLTSGSAGSGMQFAEGGIVGFDGTTGSYIGRSEGSNVLPDKTGYEGMGILEAIQAMGGDVGEFLKRKGSDAAQYIRDMEKNALQTTKSTTVPVTIPENAPAPQSLSEGAVESALKNNRQGIAQGNVTNVVSGAQTVPPTSGPRPPAAPAAGGLGSSSVAGMLQKQLAKEPAQPTTEDAINAIKGIQKGFGVDQPAGAEERAMIEEMKARYAKGQEDRGMRNLQGVLSAFGRGYGAAGLESARQSEAATNADMAQQQKVYEMINGINKANRAEGVGASKSAGELLAGREKTAGEEGRARLQALAQTYHTDVAAAAQMEASRIMAAARTGQMDERQQLAELKALQSGLQAQLKGMNQFDKAGRAPYEQQLQIINAEIAKMAGVSTMPAAPGAANAGGTPPPGAVREVKR